MTLDTRRLRRIGRTAIAVFLSVCCAAVWTVAAEKTAGGGTGLDDPYRKIYSGYVPSFIDQKGLHERSFFRQLKRGPEEMKGSSEKEFFTLCLIEEDSRATALVYAGIQKEKEGMYLQALEIYMQLHDRLVNANPNVLHRVSEYGVFVPAWQYVQRRILDFPKEQLSHYRTKYDAVARDMYQQARRTYSLIGLSAIVDDWAATSYGDDALYDLGRAALDTGHYLEASECFGFLEEYHPESECLTPELQLLAAYCRTMLGGPKAGLAGNVHPTRLSQAELTRLKETVGAAPDKRPSDVRQSHSEAYVGTDDYGPLPPTEDPLGLKAPVWSKNLTEDPVRGSLVYTHPVVTRDSLIYRYKNVIHSRSILNGELRWKNDLGGSVKWQNWKEAQWPQEDLVVQDGLVFTPMNKIGPSLVALDEITGELKWAYGPIQAATSEEAKTRILAPPAGGPGAVYAGYVLDEIEGETHTDTEYGVVAFESATGRVLWRTPLCRLQPGRLVSLHSAPPRNRIRSFASPPLYHQGTLYYSTNAGVVAALSARTGRVKWLIKYPYLDIHDSTQRVYWEGRAGWGDVPTMGTEPIPWFNQRPLLVGDNLYVLAVDSPMLMCLDRLTGKMKWHHEKSFQRAGGFAYFLGPISTGELVVTYSGRSETVQLLEPEKGQTVWKSPDFFLPDNQPVMKYEWSTSPRAHRINNQTFYPGAKPFLDTQDRLHLPNCAPVPLYAYGTPEGYCNHHTVLDLQKRTVLDRRRHYDDVMVAAAEEYIREVAPLYLARHLGGPQKQDEAYIKMMKEIIADRPPENAHGPFLPFSRVTFERYGQPFELRVSPKAVSMLYDLPRVMQVLADRRGPEAEFARAELAYMDARYEDAARALQNCLSAARPEDMDFRSAVNQQLFQVHQELARSGIRSGDRDKVFDNCLGLTRTATTLPQEVDALFAVSEAHERKGNAAVAGECLRQVIDRYGQYEYPMPSILGSGSTEMVAAAEERLSRASAFVKGSLHEAFLGQCASLSKHGLPLYVSTLTPLPRDLTVRAGDLAASLLIRLQKQFPQFADSFSKQAETHLLGRPADEQFHQLLRFPGAASSQKAVEKLCAEYAGHKDPEGRRRLWQLADTARVGGFDIPAQFRGLVEAPPPVAEPGPFSLPAGPHEGKLKDEAGTQWLVLERRDDGKTAPDFLFLGGRVRKRLDNKFLFRCMDQSSGKTVWTATEERGDRWSVELRLEGKGEEPGFFEAFVCGDRVVTCGMYDVLAFGLKDGKLLWRWRAPANFEIAHAVLNGDLLVLAGDVETLALYLPTNGLVGETVWQVKEQGALYAAPYFHGDRLISVRKMPFNATVRYRATGRLIGRLDLPSLSLNEDHPIVEGVSMPALPVAHDGKHLVVSDTWYYIMVDVETMTVEWKRLIDANDATRDPPLRFALKGDYLAVQKQDYVTKAMHMLSSRTGEVLWRTEEKDPLLTPMYSILIDGEKMYGLEQRLGVGFAVVCRECKTGKLLFRTGEKDYAGDPTAVLKPQRYGNHLVVRVQDRQDFELKVFDSRTGQRVHMLKAKGAGAFGEHGRASETVQNGRLALFGGDVLQF